MTLTPNQRSEYRELKDYSVEVRTDNYTAHNSGSETIPHGVAKHLVGMVGVRNGYRVSSEVSVKGGDIDMVLWGHSDRLTYAVEVETGILPEVKESKIDRYVEQTPIDDIQFVEVNDLPVDMIEAYAYVANELGLPPEP
jgi:hypothetical protein